MHKLNKANCNFLKLQGGYPTDAYSRRNSKPLYYSTKAGDNFEEVQKLKFQAKDFKRKPQTQPENSSNNPTLDQIFYFNSNQNLLDFQKIRIYKPQKSLFQSLSQASQASKIYYQISHFQQNEGSLENTNALQQSQEKHMSIHCQKNRNKDPTAMIDEKNDPKKQGSGNKNEESVSNRKKQEKRLPSIFNGKGKTFGSFLIKVVGENKYYRQFGSAFRDRIQFTAEFQSLTHKKNFRDAQQQLRSIQAITGDINFYQKFANLIHEVNRSAWKQSKKDRYAIAIIKLEYLDNQIKGKEVLIRIGKQERERYNQLRK